MSIVENTVNRIKQTNKQRIYM